MLTHSAILDWHQASAASCWQRALGSGRPHLDLHGAWIVFAAQTHSKLLIFQAERQRPVHPEAAP